MLLLVAMFEHEIVRCSHCAMIVSSHIQNVLLQPVRRQALHVQLPKYIRLPEGRTILCEGVASPACQKILDKTMGGNSHASVLRVCCEN
jgi:hypothetical protein